MQALMFDVGSPMRSDSGIFEVCLTSLRSPPWLWILDRLMVKPFCRLFSNKHLLDPSPDHLCISPALEAFICRSVLFRTYTLNPLAETEFILR